MVTLGRGGGAVGDMGEWELWRTWWVVERAGARGRRWVEVRRGSAEVVMSGDVGRRRRAADLRRNMVEVFEL